MSKSFYRYLDHYEVVGPDFDFPLGLLVMIVVWDLPLLCAKDTLCNPGMTCLRRLLVTGKTSRGVGRFHIECNYNGFSGCSEAAVIAIDKKNENGFLKAIAIHAG